MTIVAHILLASSLLPQHPASRISVTEQLAKYLATIPPLSASATFEAELLQKDTPGIRPETERFFRENYNKTKLEWIRKGGQRYYSVTRPGQNRVETLWDGRRYRQHIPATETAIIKRTYSPPHDVLPDWYALEVEGKLFAPGILKATPKPIAGEKDHYAIELPDPVFPNVTLVVHVVTRPSIRIRRLSMRASNGVIWTETFSRWHRVADTEFPTEFRVEYLHAGKAYIRKTMTLRGLSTAEAAIPSLPSGTVVKDQTARSESLYFVGRPSTSRIIALVRDYERWSAKQSSSESFRMAKVDPARSKPKALDASLNKSGVNSEHTYPYKLCGAFAAVVVSNLCGKNTSLDTFCEANRDIDSTGISLKDLSRLLANQGLVVKAAMCSYDEILAMQTPAMLAVRHRFGPEAEVPFGSPNHIVSVVGRKSDSLVLLDPPGNAFGVTRKALSKYWDGTVLFVSNKAISAPPRFGPLSWLGTGLGVIVLAFILVRRLKQHP